MRVLVQLRSSLAAHDAATSGQPPLDFTAGIQERTRGLEIDTTFRPVQVPAVRSSTGAPVFSLAQPLDFSMEPEDSTYIVRGSVPDGAIGEVMTRPDIVSVFADPIIESCPVCPGDSAVGLEADVADLLDVSRLQAAGLDGTGVRVAVVDTGIDIDYLQSRGRNPQLVTPESWTPVDVPTLPGKHRAGHGTMCAYDVGIVAPNAQLLDHAVLQPSGGKTMQALLSDAVFSYGRLLRTIESIPVSDRTMVVTNSWAMYSPSGDYPPGHPGNYSDNPSHPFNIIVASLESAGADILFAAGNCGRDCPEDRCGFGGAPPICGANSHPHVITVAGIDTDNGRVGYSSQGPGRLHSQKPDIVTYTHFVGSGVYPQDGGTSAACPVAAGVIAAVRTRYSSDDLAPSQLRALLYRTARDLGGTGFDYDHGWGVVNVAALLNRLP